MQVNIKMFSSRVVLLGSRLPSSFARKRLLHVTRTQRAVTAGGVPPSAAQQAPRTGRLIRNPSDLWPEVPEWDSRNLLWRWLKKNRVEVYSSLFLSSVGLAVGVVLLQMSLENISFYRGRTAMFGDGSQRPTYAP